MNDAAALTIAELSIGEYAPIRSAYKMEIGGAILEYLLTDGGKVSTFRNAFKRAITDYFQDAFYQGFSDAGGGSRSDTAPEDEEWLTAKINAEFGFCDSLFQQMRELKKDKELKPADFEAEAARRAEGYARTLDGVYSEGKLRGGKDVLATFGGSDGMESCPECQKYKGQTHKISWWQRRGLIPGQPGNGAFSCRGYNCQHFLFNAKTGDILTI